LKYDSRSLHSQAELGRVQADGQRYIDMVKLLLAAGGRTHVQARRFYFSFNGNGMQPRKFQW
jgi:hypothetical protein